jgi:RHS repeat-associated protein
MSRKRRRARGPLRFTGKERDAETGLDYFGARYLSSAQGRFTSPDPFQASAKPTDPQTWNRYAYVRGAPLVFVDVNGEWPFYVHNEIYAHSFRDLLSQSQIRKIQEVSFLADVGPGAQDPSNSPTHSMCVPGMSPTNCGAAINSFISRNLNRANDLSFGGLELNKSALSAFGRAVHALTDMGSPSHTGPAGPIEWNNGRREAAIHFLGERDASVNWFMLGQSIRLAIAGFAQAFPKLAAGKNLKALTNKAINSYVDAFYSNSFGRDDHVGTTLILQDAARMCASGNPAACLWF